MSSVATPPTCVVHDARAPLQAEAPGARSWVTRSANVVVMVSEVTAGTTLRRQDQPDEYMLLLPPGLAGQVRAGSETREVGDDSLVILPPGDSSFTARAGGVVTRVFTVRALDVAALASNASTYAQGAPGVAPLADWPAPSDGFRIRAYRLADYSDPAIFGRIFRSTNLMINVFERKTERRDPRKLSPHSHPDFEQISLALEGTHIHHLRTPWTPDSSGWRADEHLEVGSPSVLVIPANLIHTTQDVGTGVTWLVDIFGPPRMDFSSQPGVVRNAAEYPMPAANA